MANVCGYDIKIIIPKIIILMELLNSAELKTGSDRPPDVHSKDKTSYGDYHRIKLLVYYFR